MKLTKHTTRSGTTLLSEMTPNWRLDSIYEPEGGQGPRIFLGRNGLTTYNLAMSAKEAVQLGKMLLKRFDNRPGTLKGESE